MTLARLFALTLALALVRLSASRKHYLGDNGWNHFQTAVGVRHRITHPKTEANMIITDEDIQALQAGVRWYLTSIHDIIKTSDVFQLKT